MNRQHRRWTRRFTAVVATVAVGMAGMVLAASSPAGAATATASAFARGQAVEVHTTINSPGDPGLVSFATNAGVSRAVSQIDTGGIGGGEVTADGSATALYSDTPTVANSTFSHADSHAPTTETLPDTAEKASASAAGVVAATALKATSDATDSTSPSSTNAASITTASLLSTNDPTNPLPSVLITDVAANTLTASSSASGSGGSASADAASSGIRLSGDFLGGTLPLPFPPLPVSALVVSTTASADTSTGASSTCTVLVVVIGGADLDLTCAAAGALLDPLFPVSVPTALGTLVIDIDFGVAVDTSPGDCESQSGVAALRLEVTKRQAVGSTIDIGIAEACVATSSDPTLPEVCGTTVDEPLAAHGDAKGVGIHASDALGQAAVDVGVADAAVDEAGLPLPPDPRRPSPTFHGPHGAEADASLLDAQLYLVPNDPRGPGEDPSDRLRLVDTHAEAPPASSESTGTAVDILATSNLGGPLNTGLEAGLSADAVSSSAEASTAGPGEDDLDDGHAAAAVELDRVDAGVDLTGDLAGEITAGTGELASSASSTIGPADVTSTASQTIATAAASLPGVSVSADVITTEHTTAVATGVPGTATAETSFSIVDVVLDVGSGPITVSAPADGPDADSNPDELVVDVEQGGVEIATVHFAAVDSFTSPDGTFAHISVDPVRVQVPSRNAPGPYTEVVIGHTEATAFFPAASAAGGAVITKHLDIHMAYAAGQITGPAGTPEPNGVLVAPHQKYFYEICVGNSGEDPLTGLVVSDDLHPNVRIVAEPPGPSIHSGLTISGQHVETAPFDLAGGTERRFLLYVEVRPNAPIGSVIDNVATITAGDPAPMSSAPATLEVGYSPDRPALEVRTASATCNRLTRTWHLVAHIVNRGGGTAYEASIDQLTVVTPSGTNVVGVPTPPVDVQPGTESGPFEIEIQGVPGLPGTRCGRLAVVYRETALDAEGQRYAFD